MEVLEVFSAGQGSSSSSRFPGGADEGFQGIFALFSVREKVRSWVRTRGSELSADFTSVHAGCSCGLHWAVDVGRRRWGSLGGSRRLAGGTWTGTLLFGGTLLGDVAAAAGGGVCGAVLGLVGRRPLLCRSSCGRWKWSPGCSSSTSVTSLAVCWRRRVGVAAGAFSPGIGAHHTGDELM